MNKLFAAPLLAAAGIALPGSAAPIVEEKSSVVATFTQMNVQVDGRFKTFSGHVNFDPAHPGDASAELSIATASFDLGDEDYNAEVRKPEWFDAKAHPTAAFRSTSVRTLAADRFETTGSLSLKGKVQTVTASVSVKSTGTMRTFSGEFPLSRAGFAIGDAEWNEVLDDRVIVKFVIATPVP